MNIKEYMTSNIVYVDIKIDRENLSLNIVKYMYNIYRQKEYRANKKVTSRVIRCVPLTLQDNGRIRV